MKNFLVRLFKRQPKQKLRYVAYDEPIFHPDGSGKVVGNQRIIMTVKDATKVSKIIAEHEGHMYSNDEEALEDFIVINWAWLVEF
jgi:hypothetical protein